MKCKYTLKINITLPVTACKFFLMLIHFSKDEYSSKLKKKLIFWKYWSVFMCIQACCIGHWKKSDKVQRTKTGAWTCEAVRTRSIYLRLDLANAKMDYFLNFKLRGWLRVLLFIKRFAPLGQLMSFCYVTASLIKYNLIQIQRYISTLWLWPWFRDLYFKVVFRFVFLWNCLCKRVST